MLIKDYYCPKCLVRLEMDTRCPCGMYTDQLRLDTPETALHLDWKQAETLRTRRAYGQKYRISPFSPSPSAREHSAKSLESFLEPAQSAKAQAAREAIGVANREHLLARIAQLRRVGFLGPYRPDPPDWIIPHPEEEKETD